MRNDSEILRRRNSFVIEFSFTEMLQTLTDEEAGQLFKAISAYARYKKMPDFSHDRALNMAFTFFRSSEDEHVQSYLDRSRQRSEAGRKSASSRKKADSENDIEDENDLPFK